MPRNLRRLPRAGLKLGIAHFRSLRERIVTRNPFIARTFAPRLPDRLVLRKIIEPKDVLSERSEDMGAKVEPYLQRRFTVLGKTVEFKGAIDWHVDFNGGSWPILYAWDYNKLMKDDFTRPEYRVHGDIKRAWDFNKHLHFIDLARTYYSNHDERYRAEIELELLDWLRKNPYMRGIGWSAQLTVAHRAISWLLAYNLGAIQDPLSGALARSLYQHGVYLSENLEESLLSLNSNHLIGDLSALYLIGKSLGHESWTSIAMRKLLKEIDAQIYEDGVDYEQSSGYHRYVQEFLYLVWLSDDRANNKIGGVLAKMSDFLLSISWPDGTLPFFSDWDGAKVWVHHHHKPVELYKGIAPQLESRGFRNSGYYVIQYDHHKLVFDCGPIGMGNRQLATHGHSDILSFILSLFGEQILVDPGSGTYTEDKHVHDYCRSTLGHNALILDGRDECGLSRTWTVQRQPTATLVDWRTSKHADIIEGQHDGFAPVIHKRRIEFYKANNPRVVVSDRLVGEGDHEVELFFHFATQLETRLLANGFSMRGRSSRVTLTSDDGLEPSLVEGYYSPDYGVTTRALVGRMRRKITLPATVTTMIEAIPVGANYQAHESP